MINICRSNRLVHLGDQLAQRLRRERGNDPFVADNIIVPNLDTSNWLKLHIAEQNGFSGNIRFMLPAEWMWHSIRERLPGLPKELPSDPGPMKWTLFGILSDREILSRFPLLNNFIIRQPKENREDALLQVSSRLSSLYDKYLVYRPEIILRWQNGRLGSGDERWQAELWNLMNGRWKELHSAETALNRAELFDMLRKESAAGSLGDRFPLFVFNPGLMPNPITRVLREQGAYRNVTLFLISPASNHEHHPLTEMYGEESEAIQKLYSIEEAETEEFFEAERSQGSSNLSRIRNSLLSGDTENIIQTENGIIPGIEVHSCHSPLREIEVLHDSLLRILEANNQLQPDEILVVTPNLDNYLPHIHAVFDNPEPGLPAIPYHAGGSGGAQMMDRALLHLLSLPGSRFAFNDVMDFFMMDPVLEKFGLTESSALLVREWMKENHVFWGFDGGHRKEWNQPEESEQTWKAALRRGWLGQMMATGPGEFAHDTLLFPAVTSSEDREAWAAFSGFMELLHQTLHESKGLHTATQWSDLIDKWSDGFFSAKSLMDYRRKGSSSITDTIRESASLSGMDLKIPFQLVRLEIEEQLKSKPSGSARLHRGVTFSNMVPVRSLPFKMIAMTGLNEGSFPRKENTPEYDLMSQHPEPTDRNHRSEDKNLFLESLLAAETYHYCSFLGQSPVDNEPVPPSPILSGWVGFLSEQSGLDEDQIIQKESLSLFSLNNYKNGKAYSKIGFKSASAVNGASERFPFDRLGLEEDQEKPVTIGIREFCSFFSNPVKAFASKRLEARFTGEEEERDEFTVSALDKHLLYQRVFSWIAEEHRQEDDVRRFLLRSGILPAGWPGERIADEMITSVQESIEQIRALGFTPGLHRFDPDLEINGIRFAGEIISYSAERYLDLSFSSGSGSLYLQSWIQHLLLNASTKHVHPESYLISELRKEPKVHIFTVPDGAGEYLEKLMKLYLKGRKEPLQFFPKTVYSYEKNLEKGKGRANSSAVNEFEGDGWNRYPERDDLNISFLLGPGIEFDESMVNEEYRDIFRLMMDHMQEAE
jgi:exodeoxyribonuclease V gamma subunit